MNIEDKKDHLNGFTIISFNYNNKYVLFKSEIYEFNKEQIINNDNLINENESINNQELVYWIIKDADTYKILPSNNSSLAPDNYFMGPFYDENTISITLSYLNKGM